MTAMKQYDITIIGGGPVGLFAAFYAGMRQMNVNVIESLPELGGQPAVLYPEKLIYDIPAYPAISGGDLAKNLLAQHEQFHTIDYSLNQAVVSIEQDQSMGYTIKTTKAAYFSKAIIIACGNGSFQPRKLNIENASQYEGKTLHYFVDQLEQYQHKTVAICGGGDSAVDWALALEPIAKKVVIVHRRNEFRAHEYSVEKLKRSTVEIVTPFIPEQLIEHDGNLAGLRLKEARGETIREIEVDHLFVNYGFVSSLGPIKDWGFTLERNSIQVNSKMETSLPHVFAIGDIATYPGKVKLIATGFGEAPTAVNNAIAAIYPKQRLQPMHSSSLFDTIKP